MRLFRRKTPAERMHRAVLGLIERDLGHSDLPQLHAASVNVQVSVDSMSARWSFASVPEELIMTVEIRGRADPRPRRPDPGARGA